jgi:hypothetical protein
VWEQTHLRVFLLAANKVSIFINLPASETRPTGMQTVSSIVAWQVCYFLSMLEAPLFAIGLGMTSPLLSVFAAS